MTTYILEDDDENAGSDSSFSVDDLMADLDRELGGGKKTEGKKKPKRSPESYAGPVEYVPQWHPNRIVLRCIYQQCACGKDYTSVAGTYLEDITRNGAKRQVRHERGSIPPAYTVLPVEVETELEEILFCPACL